MKINSIKYFSGLLNIVAVWVSLSSTGILAWTAPVYFFVLIPILEMLMPYSEANLTSAEEELEKKDIWYDIALYMIVPLHLTLLVYFFFVISDPNLSSSEYMAKILAMGFGCGINGINVAHELGHRVKPFERVMAKIQLLSSQYMHFIIEHNRGHHKNVSTDEDGASARRNEIVYTFWIRSVYQSYMSAWSIEHERLRKRHIPIFSFKNEMIRFTMIQLLSLFAIAYFFSPKVLISYLVVAVIGFLLLETINYVEHYGLRRNKTERGTYEKVLPVHSWNSNHVLGRIMLFELTRHSDHHYKASRKYQVLRHFDDSPQLPFGYPAMVVLSLAPFIFIPMMNRKIDSFKVSNSVGAEALA